MTEEPILSVNESALNKRLDTLVHDHIEGLDLPDTDHSHEHEHEPTRNAGLGDETERMLWSIASPRKIETIDMGGPAGGYHLQEEHPDWGLQFRVEKGFSLQSVALDAQESGDLTIKIHNLSDDTVDAGTQPPRPYARRDVRLTSGEQRIPIDVYFKPGNYFIRRASGPPLRRVSGFDGWDALQDLNCGLSIQRGWNFDYRPREGDELYTTYDQGDWDKNYYYFFNPEVAYGSPLDGDN